MDTDFPIYIKLSCSIIQTRYKNIIIIDYAPNVRKIYIFTLLSDVIENEVLIL